jgi:GNAT superfamily N-acetyltransferase
LKASLIGLSQNLADWSSRSTCTFSRVSADNGEMLTIREAQAADVGSILSLIRALAEYEREPAAVVATEADLLRDGFGAHPRFQCVIAEWSGEPVGFALFFYNYSTWHGRAGIYLEDLFVQPSHRGKGIGRALLVYLAQRAQAEDLTRVVWHVLGWNTPAIEFYKTLGAESLSAWEIMRVTGPALKALAEGGA